MCPLRFSLTLASVLATACGVAAPEDNMAAADTASAAEPLAQPGSSETPCCVAGSVAVCCNALQPGDLAVFDLPGEYDRTFTPSGCSGTSGTDATCRVGKSCSMLHEGRIYMKGTCAVPVRVSESLRPLRPPLEPLTSAPAE